MESHGAAGAHIDEIPDHSHLCSFYRTFAEMEECWVPFVAQGLADDYRCLFVHGPDYSAETAAKALDKTLKHEAALGMRIPMTVEEHIANDALIICTSADIPVCPTRNSVDEVANFWEMTVTAALGDGYKGVRCAAQMTWIPEEDRCREKLVEFESAISEIFSALPLSAVCMYDMAIFAHADLHSLAIAHPFTATWSPAERSYVCDPSTNVVHLLPKRATSSQPAAMNTLKFQVCLQAAVALEEKRFTDAERLFKSKIVEIGACGEEASLELPIVLLGLVEALRGQGKMDEARRYEDQASELLLMRSKKRRP